MDADEPTITKLNQLNSGETMLIYKATSIKRLREAARSARRNPRVKRLVPWQKLCSAMNYGNYAFDAQYGRRPAGY